MKILYLHQYFNLPSDPGGTRSYEMARRLVAAGHKVYMVTSDHRNKFGGKYRVTEEDGIEVHWLPVPYSNTMSYTRRMKAFLQFAFRAAWRAASIPADLVFATSTPLTITLPGVFAAKRQRIPMVFEVRDLWPDVPIALGVIRNPFLVFLAKQLEKFAYRNASRIVALAPGMKDEICKKGFAAEKIAVIPNGADIELFQSTPGSAHPADLLPSFSEKKLIVYAGTVGLANGVDYIPRIASVLEKSYPFSEICFAIIGAGRNLSKVRELAEHLGVQDKTVYFIGSVPKKGVGVWLQSASATIMTYTGPKILYRDSVSNKFFDSLAAGRPVLANFRGFSTVVAESAGAGRILPGDDIDRAAEMLVDTVGNSRWLGTSSQAALELSRTFFNRDNLAKDLEFVLEDAVKGINPGRAGEIGVKFAELWRRALSA